MNEQASFLTGECRKCRYRFMAISREQRKIKGEEYLDPSHLITFQWICRRGIVHEQQRTAEQMKSRLLLKKVRQGFQFFGKNFRQSFGTLFVRVRICKGKYKWNWPFQDKRILDPQKNLFKTFLAKNFVQR